MTNLSPTLKLRVDAHKARKQNIANQELKLKEQNKTIEEHTKTIDEQTTKIQTLSQMLQYAIQSNYGKDGLDLCTIHTENTTELLLVNLDKYNQPQIQTLTLGFLDIHTICLMEMQNARDTNTTLSSLV
jgi:uncharacterized coiled-coil protein SlyX